MGNPLWSSVPEGRDALDLLCITFSTWSGSELRLAERVLSWVEDLKGAVEAEEHFHVKGLYFVFCRSKLGTYVNKSCVDC